MTSQPQFYPLFTRLLNQKQQTTNDFHILDITAWTCQCQQTESHLLTNRQPSKTYPIFLRT